MKPHAHVFARGLRILPNWYSASYDSATGLFYVQTNDRCGMYRRQPTADWVAGKGFMGGTWGGIPNEPAKRVLRAIDIRDGRIAWELPQEGRVNSAGGVLSTRAAWCSSAVTTAHLPRPTAAALPLPFRLIRPEVGRGL